VQADHVHLVVEADDRVALSHGASGLAIRLARTVNRLLRRRGRVWGDRYHARALATPREVRHALVYVLMNWRKHVHRARGLDPCASAFWFDGWQTRAPPANQFNWNPTDEPPVVPARTWLGTTGWRRHGLVDVRECPKLPAVAE
jgi:REP-associated tyrosine transposase